MAELTQHQKILTIITTGEKKWWDGRDFQQERQGLFIGYEASARLSEMEKRAPWLFDVRQEGKYKQRCLRTITDGEADLLPSDWRAILKPFLERERAFVASKSNPQQDHKVTVNMFNKHVCTCKGFAIRGDCSHIQTVIKNSK